MVTKRELPLLRVLLAFLIATFLFLSGFLIGYSVSYFKYQDIARRQEDIKYDLLGLDLEAEFLTSCNNLVLHSVSSELDEMGKTLDILEDRFGKTDERVLEQKKKYAFLEVQHFLNIKKYNEECDENLTTVLFLYSNKGENENVAERVGYVLNNLKSKYPEKVMVYSFDYDLTLTMIDILKAVYNITSPNTLLIDEQIKIEEIKSIEELEQYL